MSSQPIPLPDQISGYRSSVINQIRDYLISITPVDSPLLQWIRRPDGLFPVLNDGAFGDVFPWADLTFGYTVDGTDVTLVNGILVWGDTRATLADTAQTITDDGTEYFVGIEFDGTTITVPAASSDEAYFTPDDTTYRTWFYSFIRDGGAPRRERVNHMGMVEIDSAWGPGA